MSRRRHPHKNWKKSTLEKDERHGDTNVMGTKESRGSSISHVAHFIFLKDIKFLSIPHDPMTSKENHHTKCDIFLELLSDSRFSRPFHFISHGFLVDGSMVPTMTTGYRRGGFHHVPGALVQSFSTFGSFIEGGDMEDRLVFRLKTLERCQGIIVFVFCKSCISFKFVQY